MAFFILVIFFMLLAWSVYRYQLRRQRIIHYVFLVRNQQHAMEWMIRAAIIKNMWRPRLLYITVIDTGSHDTTPQIVQSLAKKYPLEFFVGLSHEESREVIQAILTNQHHSEEVVVFTADH